MTSATEYAATDLSGNATVKGSVYSSYRSGSDDVHEDRGYIMSHFFHKQPSAFFTPLCAALIALFAAVLLLCGCRGFRRPAETSAPQNTAQSADVQTTAPAVLPEADAAVSALFAAAADESFPLPLSAGDSPYAPAASGAYCSAVISVPNRVFTVSHPVGWSLEILSVGAEGVARFPVSPGDLWYGGRNERFVFVLTPQPENESAQPADLRITPLDPCAASDAENGVRQLSPRWGGSASFGGLPGAQTGDFVSAPMSLADGGLGALFGGDEKTAPRFFRAAAFRLTDNGIEAAQDPRLSGLAAAGPFQAQSVCFPETADTFVSLILDGAADPSLLTFTRGRMQTDDAHRLCGLFRMSLVMHQNAEGVRYPLTYTYYYDNYMEGQNYLGALLRAEDVVSVSCDPRFELSATVWQVREDGDIKRTTETLWNGPQPGREDLTRGYSTLSLPQKTGWILLCVRRRAEPLLNAAGELSLQSPGMGAMRGFSEVESGVRVEYAPGRAPVTERIADPVVAQNLRDYFGLISPHVYAGSYARPQEPDFRFPYPEMTDLTPVWYNGRFSANSFVHNITPYSYLTAAMNPNSRYYMFADSLGLGYGATCRDVVFSMFGFTETYSIPQLALALLTKFEREPFSWSRDLDTLRPGEILLQFDPLTHDGHVALVNEVIKNADGTVRAVSVVEGWTPFARQRSFYVCPGARAKSGLLYYAMAQEMEVFSARLRVKQAYERPLRELFAWPSSVSVGTVMCDRGDASLYCVGDPFAEFSVSDDAAAEIRVFRNGALYARLPLANAERRNGLRVVDFSSLLAEPGEYTVCTDVSAETQTRYYIPEKKAATVLEPSNGAPTARVLIPDQEEADSVYVFYRRPGTRESDPTPLYMIVVFPRADFSPDPASPGRGVLSIPASLNGRWPEVARTQYRTPYGTFWNGYLGADVRQSAESW